MTPPYPRKLPAHATHRGEGNAAEIKTPTGRLKAVVIVAATAMADVCV